MQFLKGRKFMIVGGNGFVGNCIAAKLIQHGAQVSTFSRTGAKHNYSENSLIRWYIGDIMNPSQQIQKKINQADTVVHSMAALIDPVVKGKAKPGDPGTYEQMNRDSFYKLLSVIEEEKRIFYISAVGHPPFIPRYQTTKKQAQNALLNSKHTPFIIRPGFIYDQNLKSWSIPLKNIIIAWNKIYPFISSPFSKVQSLHKFIQQFEQSQPTNLQHIAEAVAFLSQQQISDDKIFQNQLLQQIHQKYIQKYSKEN